jgi:hypothetical protein
LGFAKHLKNLLISRWRRLRRDSFIEGYSHGIANTIKFETRLYDRLDELAEGEHIYGLTSYITGQGLTLRNKAEAAFKDMDYEAAKSFLYDFYESGAMSGNRLNAIKGLLGIAKCNKALQIDPILGPENLRTLKELMRSVEGKNWQKTFKKLLMEIDS